MTSTEAPLLATKPADTNTNDNDPFRRFRRIDISGIAVHRAVTDADWASVAALRRDAYSRLDRPGTVRPRGSWLDEADRGPGTHALIGTARDGTAIATLRMQDDRLHPVELHRHVALAELVPPDASPYTQFARLASRRSPEALDVMFALFKAAWSYSLVQGIQSIVIATPPWTRRIYDYLMFRDLGPAGRFRHPFSTEAPHVSMSFDVPGAERLWRSVDHPLCRQFFDERHESLQFWHRSHSIASAP